MAEQFLHRSYRFTLAGHDQIEEAEISINVERKAMRRDPARDMHTDRGYLSLRGMDAGQTLDSDCFDGEITHRANQDFFQVAHKAVHVLAIRAEVDYWIAYYLALAMIGKLTAAIGFKEADAAGVEQRFGQQ